ncbi:MAG: glycosyltransferase [Lachnospiraceae bacterium]
MKLSIIVPVYNMALDGKLKYCIDSLLHQTISDFEIIAVDDSSHDTSLSILQEYALQYPELITVIASQENLKQGGAKNLGIHAAGGEWIGFVDSDDWIAPDMYEKLLNRAEETGADVVGCDYSLVRKHTMTVGQVIQNNTDDQTGILDEAAYRKILLHAGSMVIKIYKREIIVENKLWFPEHIFYEDNCASPLWMLHCTHFEKVNEPLYYYYQHEDSTVHVVSESRCKDRLTAMEQLMTECEKRGWLVTYHQELEFKFAELYLVNTLFTYMQGNNPKHLVFLRKMKKGIKRRFPEFQQNPYYQARFDKEEKKLIRYFCKSELFFLIYYKALYWYRRKFTQ